MVGDRWVFHSPGYSTRMGITLVIPDCLTNPPSVDYHQVFEFGAGLCRLESHCKTLCGGAEW